MFDYAYISLENGMKEASEKQAVHAHNLANANTPGYVPMDFDEELGKAVKRQDGKKVIIEDEMAKLSENSIKYSAYVKLLSQKINILRTIATQGRR